MSQLIDDIATYLQSNGVGTLGINLFEGRLPSSPDAAVAVIETGGTQPNAYIPTKSPSFQVLIRATELDLGETVRQTIRSLLHNQYNTQFVLGGIYFYYCRLITEGGHIGVDSNGRDLFSLNFECYIR